MVLLVLEYNYTHTDGELVIYRFLQFLSQHHRVIEPLLNLTVFSDMLFDRAPDNSFDNLILLPVFSFRISVSPILYELITGYCSKDSALELPQLNFQTVVQRKKRAKSNCFVIPFYMHSVA